MCGDVRGGGGAERGDPAMECRGRHGGEGALKRIFKGEREGASSLNELAPRGKNASGEGWGNAACARLERRTTPGPPWPLCAKRAVGQKLNSGRWV